jgi:integrase
MLRINFISVLTYQEAENLLAGLKKISASAHDQALISLHCGLRAGEIFNLRGQDQDFQNRIIRIMDPKNGSARIAFMTGAIKSILAARIPPKLGDFVFRDREHGGLLPAPVIQPGLSSPFYIGPFAKGFSQSVKIPESNPNKLHLKR